MSAPVRDNLTTKSGGSGISSLTWAHECGVSTNTNALQLATSHLTYNTVYASHADSTYLSIVDGGCIEVCISSASPPTVATLATIISKANSSFTGYYIGVDNNGYPICFGTNFNTGLNPAVNVCDGATHRLSLIPNGASSKLIVDGTVYTGTMDSVTDSADDFVVGSDQGGVGGEDFVGTVDDIRLWSTAPSDAYLIANKFTELTGSETNLAYYAKLNNDYADATGHVTALTATGSPTFVTGLFSTAGTNLTLVVSVFIDGGSTSEVITGITYNSVAMTQASKLQRASGGPNSWTYRYYLHAPDTGSHNVVVSISGSHYIDYGIAQSWSNTDQSQNLAAAGNHAESAAIGGSISVSPTTTVDNSLVDAYGYDDNGSVAAGTGMTSRATMSGTVIVGDSNGGVHPAGSYTIGITGGGGDEGIMALVISPIASTAYTMATTVGAFTLTGNNVNLPISHRLAATVGAFALTGINAILTKGYGFAATVGAFVLTGIDANFTKTLSVACSAGAFVLTGNSVNLPIAHTLAATVGAFVLTGNNVNLAVGNGIVCAVGAFVLTGIDVVMTKVFNPTLAASVGQFVLTGISARLVAPTWTGVSASQSTWTPVAANSSTWTDGSTSATPWTPVPTS